MPVTARHESDPEPDGDDVIGNRRGYDFASREHQARIRSVWALRIEQRRVSLDLAAIFTAQGRPFVEMCQDGSVRRRPIGSAEISN